MVYPMLSYSAIHHWHKSCRTRTQSPGINSLHPSSPYTQQTLGYCSHARRMQETLLEDWESQVQYGKGAICTCPGLLGPNREPIPSIPIYFAQVHKLVLSKDSIHILRIIKWSHAFLFWPLPTETLNQTRYLLGGVKLIIGKDLPVQRTRVCDDPRNVPPNILDMDHGAWYISIANNRQVWHSEREAIFGTSWWNPREHDMVPPANINVGVR